MGLLNYNPLGAHQVDQYLADFAFTARIDAGAVTILGKDYGSDVVYARSANGVYTITISGRLKPFVAKCWANVRGNSNVTANATYDASTGAITVRLWAQAGGADNTAVDVDVFLLGSRSSQTK